MSFEFNCVTKQGGSAAVESAIVALTNHYPGVTRKVLAQGEVAGRTDLAVVLGWSRAFGTEDTAFGSCDELLAKGFTVEPWARTACRCLLVRARDGDYAPHASRDAWLGVVGTRAVEIHWSMLRVLRETSEGKNPSMNYDFQADRFAKQKRSW